MDVWVCVYELFREWFEDELLSDEDNDAEAPTSPKDYPSHREVRQVVSCMELCPRGIGPEDQEMIVHESDDYDYHQW